MTSENPENPVRPEQPAIDGQRKTNVQPTSPHPKIPIATAQPQAKPPEHCRETICKTKRDWIDWATLGLEGFGLLVLIVYTIATIAIWCANKKAADAAKQSADTADRSFRVDARPYVVIDNVWKANKPDKNIKDATIVPFAPYSDSLAPVVVELFYTVTGHTPAIGVRRHIRVISESNAIIAKEAIEKFPTECPKLPEGNPPMSTGNHAWGDRSENLFKPEEIKRMVNDDAPMYVYGAIEYRDLFNGCHVTRFCFVEHVNAHCAPEGCFENCEWGNWLDDPRDVPQETHP